MAAPLSPAFYTTQMRFDFHASAEYTSICRQCGAVAQLVERFVRNEEARGSNPLSSILIV